MLYSVQLIKSIFSSWSLKFDPKLRKSLTNLMICYAFVTKLVDIVVIATVSN